LIYHRLLFKLINGSEFSDADKYEKNKGFVHSIKNMGVQHNFIPPCMSNFNSDVESVHNTIENEFYDLEYFILNIISFLKFLFINFIIISFVKILIKIGKNLLF